MTTTENIKTMQGKNRFVRSGMAPKPKSSLFFTRRAFSCAAAGNKGGEDREEGSVNTEGEILLCFEGLGQPLQESLDPLSSGLNAISIDIKQRQKKWNASRARKSLYR